MTRCASVQKKGSLQHCEAPALRSHTLCGRHARCKVPVLWRDIHAARGNSLHRFQAIARGWLLRRRLLLAGPGVLKRKELGNDEDLFTCEAKERHNPLEYFSFEENGKVWWFDFASLWQWSTKTHNPTNPYTKIPLSTDTRKRLRSVWSHRLRSNMKLPEESRIYPERLLNRWNVLSQIFSDYGFEDVHPQHFMGFGKAEYLSAFILMKPDIETVFPASDVFRATALRMCQRGRDRASVYFSDRYILESVSLLLIIVSLHKDPYSMIFTVLSALHRC